MMDSTIGQSLMSDETPDLFGNLPDDYWLGVPDHEIEKRVTATTLARCRGQYRAIATLLAMELPVIDIARLLNTSERAVRVVRDREAAKVAENKEGFGRACLRTAAKLRAHVERRVDDMSGKDAAIAMGILTEKGLLLMGEATAILAQKAPAVDRAAVEAYLRGLPSASPPAAPPPSTAPALPRPATEVDAGRGLEVDAGQGLEVDAGQGLEVDAGRGLEVDAGRPGNGAESGVGDVASGVSDGASAAQVAGPQEASPDSDSGGRAPGPGAVDAGEGLEVAAGRPGAAATPAPAPRGGGGVALGAAAGGMDESPLTGILGKGTISGEADA